MRVFELHAPVKVIQRSKGRSAVAAAAYRSGESLEDERTGVTHDYTRKNGVEMTALLLPDNAPEFAHDRSQLWNQAEAAEKHPRAQTAREIEVSFPHEFNVKQRREAAQRIGRLLVDRGYAADIAMHRPSPKSDERNHHCHILWTTRKFERGGWAKTKERTFDDLKKGPEEIKKLREEVAGVLNNIATRERLPVYVEHLSYETRGEDIEPTVHMGPMATQIEREGRKSYIGEKNREIKARNEQRRQLHQQKKVIDLELARLELRERASQTAQDDPRETFYREAQERRGALLEAHEREFGARERELRLEAVRLSRSLANAKVITRMLRYFSGQTKTDRESLSKIKGELETIHQRKQADLAAFERDRKARLDALLKEQARREPPAPPVQKTQEEKRREEIRERRTEPARAPEPAFESKPAPSPAPAQEKPAQNDYAARRRAFFRQRALKQRQEQNERKERPRAQKQAQKKEPAKPLPSREFNAAGGGHDEIRTGEEETRRAREANPVKHEEQVRKERESEPGHRPANDFDRAAGYQERRERFMTQRQKARDRGRGGPDREM